jgi:hypothetical protein
MVGLGLIGVYLAHVFDEVKGRPLYRIDASRSSLLDGNSGVQRETPAPLQERRATASESAAEESMTRGGESAAHPSGDR